MQSKHIVFAASICLLCAGAVTTSIVGLSEPVSASQNKGTIMKIEQTPEPILGTQAEVASGTLTLPEVESTTTNTGIENDPNTPSSTTPQ